MRKPLIFHSTPPWLQGTGDVEICPLLPGCSGKDDSEAAKIEAALARIRAINAEAIIYTDGSAAGGTLDGGAAAVITSGDPSHPLVSETMKKRGAIYTASYDEEVLAMEMAVEWLSINKPASGLIVTDSQSLCEALLGLDPNLDPLRRKLKNTEFPLTIQWVPGHSNIPGNELADAAAKAATKLDEQATPVSYGSICTAIRQMTRDPPPSHERTKEVYRGISHNTEWKTITSRRDQTLLAKIRSGHTTLFRAYADRINNEEEDTLIVLIFARTIFRAISRKR